MSQITSANAFKNILETTLKKGPEIVTAASKNIRRSQKKPTSTSCAEARKIKRKSASTWQKFTWIFHTPLNYESTDAVIERIITKLESHKPEDDNLSPDQQSRNDIQLVKKLFEEAELPIEALTGIYMVKKKKLVDWLKKVVKKRLKSKSYKSEVEAHNQAGAG